MSRREADRACHPRSVLWKVIAGVAIIAFAIRQMFQDLFHPTQSGALSEWIARRLFRFFRQWPSMLPTSGPLSMAVVILAWAMLLATGFAFIYWSAFPGAFEVKAARGPAGESAFVWSFYYSLEMLTTLGLGDIQPNATWLRLLSGFHTLIGFSLVTASITWIVLVFPALRRLRTLARKAVTLDNAEKQTGVPVSSPGMHDALIALGEEVIQSRVDLIHFPMLFYFHAEDPPASLPCALFPMLRFAKEGAESRDDLVRLASTGLGIALRDLADLIGERLKCKDRTPEAVFRVYRDLHTP